MATPTDYDDTDRMEQDQDPPDLPDEFVEAHWLGCCEYCWRLGYQVDIDGVE